MTVCWKYLLCVLILLLLRALGYTAPEVPTPLARLHGKVVLDGTSDEPAWQEIDPLPLTMYEPQNGGKPTERTEIRVAYDDDYLYASARCYDSDAAGVRANSLYRDRWSGDDTFELVMDTFNDNENAMHFETNPNGIRYDEAISNDASGSNAFNTDWNTVWDVAVRRNADGWFAEMRIPFTSLRFKPENGRVIMGLTAFRSIVRKNETDIFPAREPRLERAVFRPSLAQRVLLQGIAARKPLYVAPYVLTGLGQSSILSALGRSYRLANDTTGEAGGDAKYSLRSDLTMDVTVNTDFAQVESDDLQVNLNRFSLFYPEKRPFFQERASLLNFPIGRSGLLFYSRRIGLDDNGQPLRIYGGGRLSGGLAGWDTAILDMQTAGSDANPPENFGVLRMRHPILNDASYAGGLLTSRIGADGSRSVSYGLDSNLRFWGKDTLSLSMAQTLNDKEATSGRIFPSGMVRAQWERPSITGWGYRAGWTYSGPDFDPAIGFLEREDFGLIDLRLVYGIKNSNASPIRIQNFSVNQVAYTRNSDHSLETSNTWATWEVNFKNGTYLNITPSYNYEDVREPFSLSDHASVPAGSYTTYAIESDYNTPWGNKAGIEVGTFTGGFFDGHRFGVRFWPRWYVSKNLELSSDLWFSHAVFPDRGQAFNLSVLRLRANVALNTSYSISSFLQYDSVSGTAGINVRFRYNPREGNDIYVVYNQGFDTDRPDTPPIPPLTTARTLQLKYVHTFDFPRS